eukprot:3657895-Lingulodinium_polyedra.AAC.1
MPGRASVISHRAPAAAPSISFMAFSKGSPGSRGFAIKGAGACEVAVSAASAVPAHAWIIGMFSFMSYACSSTSCPAVCTRVGASGAWPPPRPTAFSLK